MSSHVYHEVLLHLNWHTKADHPMLTGQTEELTHAFLHAKAQAMRGVELLKLGGTDTHIHMAVRIEPFVTISDMVQELKGASAFETNKRLRHKAIEWQRGYGVVSFGAKNPAWVIDYIEHQREHHAAGRARPRLETCEPDMRDGQGSDEPA